MTVAALAVSAALASEDRCRLRDRLQPLPPAASGNACVAPDGTLRRVGRFTARSRCR